MTLFKLHAMILSDRDIKKSLKDGRISIDPLFPKSIQPASVDLHLGADFLFFRTSDHVCIDPKEPIDHMMEATRINDKKQFIIHPGEFALGMTYEVVGVGDDMVGRLEGKSSLGRIGLIIHATAGYLDPGNKLKMTLELSATSRPYRSSSTIKCRSRRCPSRRSHRPPNIRTAKTRLGSKYYGAMKPQASQYWKNFKKNNEWMRFGK